MRVSILIPTHNRGALLEQTLRSVGGIVLPVDVEVELIVVANACTDRTIGLCERVLPGLGLSARVVDEPTAGLSVARNRAVAESRGEICAFLDDDVRVDANWLKGLVAAYEQTPAHLVGGKVDLWWGEIDRPAWFSQDSLLSRADLGDRTIELFEPFGLVGANFSFRHEVFEQIGGFRADLGRCGKSMVSGEESEFIQRAQRAGFGVFYTPDARIEHWVPAGRVTPKYLASVAFGNAYSHQLMKTRIGPMQVIRSFAGNTGRMVYHGPLELAARVRGDKASWVGHLCMRQVGAGVLRGLIHRLLTQRPADQDGAKAVAWRGDLRSAGRGRS